MSDRGSPGVHRRSAGALLALALIAASTAGGFLFYRLSAPHPGLTPVPEAASPQALTPPAVTSSEFAPVNRKIPDDVPAIELPGLDGVPRNLLSFSGRPLLINFWATWCEPCRREIPLLQTLRREQASSGLEVVGIAIDHAKDVSDYARTRKIDYPILVGERGGFEAARAFGVEAVLPFTVFAEDGRVITLKVGELHADEVQFILDRLADLRQGRLSPEAARTAISEGISRLAAARSRNPKLD